MHLAGQQRLHSRCYTHQMGELNVDLDKRRCEHAVYCFANKSSCQTISILWNKYNAPQKAGTIPRAPRPPA